MTLKNNRAPLLCYFKLCASFRSHLCIQTGVTVQRPIWAGFHCHMWIQTGVRVRKLLSWVLTSVTLTFDFWPWPFAWTSLLTMEITPEIFMMIRWWEHGEKGVTDGQTDRQIDRRTDRLNQSYSWLVAAKKPYCNATRYVALICETKSKWSMSHRQVDICIMFCWIDRMKFYWTNSNQVLLPYAINSIKNIYLLQAAKWQLQATSQHSILCGILIFVWNIFSMYLVWNNLINECNQLIPKYITGWGFNMICGSFQCGIRHDTWTCFKSLFRNIGQSYTLL